MSKQIGLLVVPCLLFAGMSIAGSINAAAQGGTTPPPKVLIIQNERTKPGQNGAPHQKTGERLCPGICRCELAAALFRHGINGGPSAVSILCELRLV